MSRYIAESITIDAGRFGHVGLCQLCTDKDYMAKRPASVVIDSLTYLLTISSPNIDNVAMSLYDIINNTNNNNNKLVQQSYPLTLC